MRGERGRECFGGGGRGCSWRKEREGDGGVKGEFSKQQHTHKYPLLRTDRDKKSFIERPAIGLHNIVHNNKMEPRLNNHDTDGWWKQPTNHTLFILTTEEG